MGTTSSSSPQRSKSAINEDYRAGRLPYPDEGPGRWVKNLEYRLMPEAEYSVAREYDFETTARLGMEEEKARRAELQANMLSQRDVLAGSAGTGTIQKAKLG